MSFILSIIHLLVYNLTCCVFRDINYTPSLSIRQLLSNGVMNATSKCSSMVMPVLHFSKNYYAISIMEMCKDKMHSRYHLDQFFKDCGSSEIRTSNLPLNGDITWFIVEQQLSLVSPLLPCKLVLWARIVRSASKSGNQ